MQQPPIYPQKIAPDVTHEVSSLEQRRVALIASINYQRTALADEVVQIRQTTQPFANLLHAVFAWRRSLLVSAAVTAIATVVATRLMRKPALSNTVQGVQQGLRWWLMARVVGRIAAHWIASRSQTQSPTHSSIHQHHVTD